MDTKERKRRSLSMIKSGVLQAIAIDDMLRVVLIPKRVEEISEAKMCPRKGCGQMYNSKTPFCSAECSREAKSSQRKMMRDRG